MLPLAFKVPVEGNDTEHKTNEREGSIKLVRRGRHCGARNRQEPVMMEALLTL
jgi:hypothetical protein